MTDSVDNVGSNTIIDYGSQRSKLFNLNVTDYNECWVKLFIAIKVEEGVVRLTGGSNIREGLVEIYHKLVKNMCVAIN